MFQDNRSCFGCVVVFMLLLATRVSIAQTHPEVWGKRIWEYRIDAEHQIVVDEKGLQHNDPNTKIVMSAPMYYWRLLKIGENDGPVLFRCLGYNPASGVGPALEKVTVLCTSFANGDLITVFNKHEAFTHRDRCWAYIINRKPDGSFKEKLEPDGVLPPFAKRSGAVGDKSIGPAMKSAEVIKQSDGTIMLILNDDQNHSFQFQLRFDKDEQNVRYYLEPISATTQSK